MVPAWLKIENSTIELSLWLYLYSSQAKTLGKSTQKPFLKNTLTICHEAHTFLNDTPKVSCFTSMWGNEKFKPGRCDMVFRPWMERGLSKLKDLTLKDKFDLSGKLHFKNMQLRTLPYTPKLKPPRNAHYPPLSNSGQYPFYMVFPQRKGLKAPSVKTVKKTKLSK